MVQQAKASSSPSSESSELVYFLAEKNFCLIVSLIGKLGRKNIAALQSCIKELEKSKAKWIIINFRDVSPIIDEPMVAELATLQKKVRAKPAALKLCSLHPELRTALIERGVIRLEETNNNLTEALFALNTIEKSVA
jgi:anti-anti-sigma regulatory factor